MFEIGTENAGMFRAMGRENLRIDICVSDGTYTAWVEYDKVRLRDGLLYGHERYEVGNPKGYKTERGVINACENYIGNAKRFYDEHLAN